MSTTKSAKTYRLTPETICRIEQIAREQGGLKFTTVIENAVEKYHASLFDRGAKAPPSRPGRRSNA